MSSRKHGNLAFFIPHLGCSNQCSFCDQRAISGTRQAPDPAAIAAVCRDALAAAGQPQTMEIAFFGGSFTAIPRETMLACLSCVQPYLGADGFGGIRISTRPDAISEEILSLLKQYGVTAIELGAQSMSDRVLQLNRRGHTAQQIRQAAQQIREAGFSLGLQMMYGLYGSTPRDELDTLYALAELQPDTMRLYPTVILEGTELAELYRSGAYVLPAWEDMLDFTAAALCFFRSRNIAVIRCGLHAEEALAERMLAGFYHPALRELAESRLYRRAMEQWFAAHPEQVQAIQVVAEVGAGCAGKAAGHQGCNRKALWEAYAPQGKRSRAFLRIAECPALAPEQMRLYGIYPAPDGGRYMAGEEVYDVFKITGITGL